MKTRIDIKYMLLVVALVLGLTACNDSEDPISNRIFLSEAIGLEKSTLFVIPDAGTQVTVTPRIAKALDRDLEVEVYIGAEALEVYNNSYGTSYQLMDETRYRFINNKVTIPAGKVAGEPVKVDLDALIPDENKSGFIYALPLSVRAVDNNLDVLASSATYFYAAQPVPMADVPQLQKYCTMVLPLAQDYEFDDWTFETLFNGSRFSTSNAQQTWLATGVAYNAAGTASGVANGFMLRLGDAGAAGNILNGRIQASAKGTGTTGLKNDIWHHVAIVCANKKITVYVDGSVDYSMDAAIDKMKFVAQQGIRLGGENREGAKIISSTRYRYSQVRLWGEARTVEQIKNNMYGVSEDSPNLIGYWKLDSYTEGTATVNQSDTDTSIGGSAATMVIDTYFFKDYTGKNPDAFVDRNPTKNAGGLDFATDRRIEIGYKFDGTLP